MGCIFKRLFGKKEELSQEDVIARHKTPLEFAAATLLLEVALSDKNFAPEEQRHVMDKLQKTFRLSPRQTQELMTEAKEYAEKSLEVLSATRKIREHWSIEDREKLLELLWEVVLADKIIDKEEEDIMYRIAPWLMFDEAKSHAIRDRVKAKMENPV
jgi:uncharacterized tellurite resistance protein B-like protein